MISANIELLIQKKQQLKKSKINNKQNSQKNFRPCKKNQQQKLFCTFLMYLQRKIRKKQQQIKKPAKIV